MCMKEILQNQSINLCFVNVQDHIKHKGCIVFKGSVLLHRSDSTLNRIRQFKEITAQRGLFDKFNPGLAG